MRRRNRTLIFNLLISCIVLSLGTADSFADGPLSRLVVIGAPFESTKAAEEAQEKKESPSAEKQSDAEKKESGEKSSDKAANNADEGSDETKEEKDADKKSAADEKSSSEKKSSKPKKPASKKPKPHEVKRDELKIEVKLSGIFVADEMEELTLRPEAWTRFKVLEAVAHGTKVNKGDVLVRFDDEDLEKSLAEKSLDQLTEALTLTRDEEELQRVKRLLELSFESAERRYEQTKDDYEYYHETDRPITVQITKYRLKSSEEQLAAAREELNQLQKMYEADELTEETEEIVLRRQRFAVETAELVHELAQESHDYAFNVSLPRTDEYYKTSLEEAEIAYEQAKSAVETGLTRKNYDMEKKRNSRYKSIERHGKLLSDKGLMTIRSPTDGVVYYGKCVNGKWSQISSMKAKLKPFGTVAPKTTFMTIVKPGTVHVVASLSEKQLPDVAEGMTVTVIPTADKELEFTGKVTHVDTIPGASNKFHVEIEVNTDKAPEWLVAGLTCDAQVVAYENDEALVIPLDYVQTDEKNKKIKYVMLLETDDDEQETQPVRRNVKLGRKQGKVVEVLKGLEEGDEIVKKEKKDKAD